MSPRSVAAVALTGLAVLAVALLLLARREPAKVPAKPDGSAPLRLPALTAASEIVPLQVPGFDGARVSLPTGTVQPRPIVIVLPAEGDSAEQHCKIWRGITQAHTFVLCPQLAARQDPQGVETELRGALRELKSKYGRYVLGGSVILAGFGSGAEHAVRIARHEPSFFARLVLVDGGYASFGATEAGTFAQRGGQRLLFACSSERCRAAIESKMAVLRSQNLAVELLHVGELPGPLDSRMVAELSDHFTWLTSNDRPTRVPNPRGVVPE